MNSIVCVRYADVWPVSVQPLLCRLLGPSGKQGVKSPADMIERRMLISFFSSLLDHRSIGINLALFPLEETSFKL